MKINAVHLQNSCSQLAPDGVARRGVLYKKSESSRSFKKRWFLLRDNLLFYFSRKRQEDPAAATRVGLIVIEGCCVERLEGLSFQLSFPGSGERNYVLAAETEEDREDWMQAIIGAGFGFMQYAIAEMEQTIDALGKAQMEKEKVATASSSIPDDTGQKGAVGVKGGQAMSIEINSFPSPTVDESKRTEELVSCNSRLIFEQMHLQFRKEIERKTKNQHKLTYVQH